MYLKVRMFLTTCVIKSFLQTNERLWRKNRAPNSGSSCLGTDLNRNYNYMWGGEQPLTLTSKALIIIKAQITMNMVFYYLAAEGVSNSPCSDIFCGSSAASELETKAVQNEGARIGSTVDGWLTFHSYGYMWMHPWGNTVNNNGFVCERATDHAEMVGILNLIQK